MPFFHCNSTPLEPGSIIKFGNWGRIIKNVGWQHNLAFREAVFEDIREREFADKPSRMNCSFIFDSHQIAELYRRMDMGRAATMIVYEVEPVTPGAPRHSADWRAATDAVGPVNLEWVRDYWRGVMRPPIDGIECREVLALSDLRIVRRI
jgi:hypothetical protein